MKRVKQAEKKLEKGVTQRLKDALASGDVPQALELCEQLPKDFNNMYLALEQAINVFYLPYTRKLLKESQGKLAQEVKKAIEEKNYALANELLDKKLHQYQIVHDTYIETLARLFGMIEDAFGDEALEAAHRNWGDHIKEWYGKREKMSAEDQVKYCTFIFNEHLSEKITVDEDEEKFTVTLDGCGSGGRLLRKGLYEDASGSLKKVSRPQVMTGKDADYPIYCTHCQILFGAFPMELYGNPLWIVDTPKKAEDPCRILIYKDRSKIPGKYRQRWRR